MSLRDTPVQLKLLKVMMLTTGAVLALTSLAYFAYELVTFRSQTRTHLAAIARITASNSAAALAFDSREEALDILSALQAEQQIDAAVLFDTTGLVFAVYPDSLSDEFIPAALRDSGFAFQHFALEGFQPVRRGDTLLGTLYLRSNLDKIFDWLRLFAILAGVIIVAAILLTWFLSLRLRSTISQPILSLAETARLISEQRDYSVRAEKQGQDEVGTLTEAFNHMLDQIHIRDAEIRLLNSQLEARILERTRELEEANQELFHLNEELEQSNRDLEQFASIASHDLQEPLRKILIFAELAENSKDNSGALQQYLEKISSSANRLTQLTSAILNYSRVSKSQDQFERVELQEIFRQVRTDLELRINEKNAEVSADHLPTVTGKPVELFQLFLNLISNSLKFSERDPVIRITTRTLGQRQLQQEFGYEGKGNYVLLIFEDNGIGFEQKYAEKAFTIFQRLHSTRKYSGTGIGLALCRRIVENHRGFIHVESEPGKGSRFFVFLPAA